MTHSVLCGLGLCPECGGKMTSTGSKPVGFQKVDIPPVMPEVTEYVRPVGVCELCGRRAVAPLPKGADHGLLGPRAVALIGYLSGAMRLSRRRVQRLLEQLMGITVSLGAVSNAEARVSTALAVPHSRALAFVQQQAVVGADETGVPLPDGRG